MQGFTRETVIKQFLARYGNGKSSVRVYAAPARINIIGEHIDYNGGYVLPCAIDKYLLLAIRKRSDNKINYADLVFPENFSFSLAETFSYKKENSYANYLNGIISILQKKDFTFSSGFDVLIASGIPSAGGISSSSALECAFAFALSKTFGFKLSQKEIALVGQASEHEFMNVQCGIMDQFIIATAKKNTAAFLDCEKISCEYVPLKLNNFCFVVMNTKKKRMLADSKYNERRSECEKALALLKHACIELPENKLVSNTRNLQNLCELSENDFELCKSALENDTVLLKRARHCVTENERVKKAKAALSENNLHLLGNILKAGHESMRDDYEATGIELDTLVEAAQKQSACIGARMTGAGFGGCAIALVEKKSVNEFIENVQNAYTHKIGYACECFSCSTSDGVHELF